MSIWFGVVGAVVLWAWVLADRRAERKRFDAERRAFQKLVEERQRCGAID